MVACDLRCALYLSFLLCAVGRGQVAKNPNGPHLPSICSTQAFEDRDKCASATRTLSTELQTLSRALKTWKRKNDLLFQSLEVKLTELKATLGAIMDQDLTTPSTTAFTTPSTTPSTTTPSPPAPLADCTAYMLSGARKSGVYKLLPPGADKPFDAFCEMTDSGVYTVMQRRINGEVDFYRDWASYRSGFGDLNGEHWLGLEGIHSLTSNPKGLRYELVVDIWDWRGNHGVLRAPNFTVGDSSTNYKLDVPADYYAYPRNPGLGGGASGFRIHRGPFNTFDHGPFQNCAVKLHCGWWFINGGCFSNANFNGRYYNGGYNASRQEPRDGLFFPNVNQSLKKITMKLRRMHISDPDSQRTD